MATYQLLLHDGATNPPARLNLKAIDDGEAIIIASVVAEACSDSCTSYEVWDSHRLVASAASSNEPSNVRELGERRQQIVIDRELMLRDSRSHIAQSRKLLKRMDEFILAMEYLS
jgi:hypothetical protein